MEQRVNNLTEKYAQITAELADVKARQEAAQDDRDELKKTLDSTNKALNELLLKVSRWEGKFGGILFIVGCLWVFLSEAGKALANWAQAWMTFKGS
jgi:hypothetical protein